MPLRETWESDGNQGWKDGVPGRKKEIREIKKPFREPAWGQPEEPGGDEKMGFPEHIRWEFQGA